MALKSMAYTADEAKAAYGCSPVDSDDANLPKYPWGLSISLDNEALSKLGITTFPAVGTEMMLVAKVKITGLSSREREGAEPSSCMDMQITEMDLAATGVDAATKLYGDS